jgi:hypothetical protein
MQFTPEEEDRIEYYKTFIKYRQAEYNKHSGFWDDVLRLPNGDYLQLAMDEQADFIYGLAACRAINLAIERVEPEDESELFDFFANWIVESRRYFQFRSGSGLAKKYKAYEKEGDISLLRAKHRDFLKQ